jgi:hypothetical protein
LTGYKYTFAWVNLVCEIKNSKQISNLHPIS